MRKAWIFFHSALVFLFFSLALVVVASGVELSIFGSTGTFSTTRGNGNTAVAVSTEIAVSPTDLTDLKSYIDALAAMSRGPGGGTTLPSYTQATEQGLKSRAGNCLLYTSPSPRDS